MTQVLAEYNQALHPAKWSLSLPFGGAKMLLVEASPSFASPWQAQGWDVDFWAEGAEMPSSAYNAILVPWSMAYVDGALDWVRSLRASLAPGGVLMAYLPHALYYARLLQKSSREMRPWPADMPMGRSYMWSEIQGLDGDLLEQVDAQVAESGFAHWKFVDGLDAKVILPVDSREKRRSFTHGWIWSFQSAQADLYEKEVMALEKSLEAGVFAGAEQRLDLLYAQKPGDYRLSNFKGILAFYKGDLLGAYQKFLQALELDAAHYDLWQNALDAAKHLHREADLLELYALKAPSLGLPEQLLLD